MTRKVLWVMDTINVGGTERSMLAIGAALRRYEPHLITCYRGDALASEARHLGISWESLNLDGGYRFVQAADLVSRRIRGLSPDIVQATLFRSEVIARLALAGTQTPLVGSFVNDSYATARFSRLGPVGGVKLRAVQLLDGLTSRRCDAFVANSNAVGESNARALSLSPERIEVIHRGRNSSAFRSLTGDDRRDLRIRLGLGVDDFIVMNVARLLERKGQAELIKAFGRVVSEIPQARLVLVGEGGDRRRLELLALDEGVAGHVAFLGERHDVPELLSIADVFALPSHFEGHSGALIEAMFAHCAIIASNTPANAESVRDGESAELFPVGDVAAIANLIVALGRDDARRASLSRRAGATARDKFTIEAVAAAHEDLYDRVLAAKRARLPFNRRVP